MLILAAGGTALVATYAAGIWDSADARALADQTWQATVEWIREPSGKGSTAVDLAQELTGQPAPVSWQITLRTGDIYQAEPGAEWLPLQTEFGPLKIPVEDVLAVAPDNEAPVSLQRSIAELIDQLGDPDSQTVRQAADRLVRMGTDASAQLTQAQSERELTISRAAANVLARIHDAGIPVDQAPQGDLVVTRYFALRGQLDERTMATTADGDGEPVAWNQVREARRQGFDTPFRNVIAAPVEPSGPVVVETERGQHTGDLQPTSLGVETPYGKLEVPWERIASIQRPAAGSMETAEQATIDLLRAEDAAGRSAAIARLAEAGPAAIRTLQRVATCDDPQASAAARAQLSELAAEGWPLAPLPFRITTPYGDVGGAVQDQTLALATDRGEVEEIPLDTIRSLKRREPRSR